MLPLLQEQGMNKICLSPPPTDEHQDPEGARKMAENGASGEENERERTYH
jgi:hypothetical protein